MHTHRCSACANCGPSSNQYPSGTCNFNGVVLILTPKIREWIGLHGCCVYKRPSLIDGETVHAARKLDKYMDAIAGTPFPDEVD